ncbi:MAG: hypothetical protein JW395_2407 [Nitrospira sp.]|nr:hypothetical protein [Nitrospira sp.]
MSVNWRTREEANRDMAEAFGAPSNRGCGNSRAGAVDADGFAGARAGGCVVSSGTAYHPRVLACAATDDSYRLSWARSQRVDQPASGWRDHRAYHLSIRASGGSWIEYQGWGACPTGADPSWAIRRRSCGDTRWTQGTSPGCETRGGATGEGDRASDCTAGL